MVDGRDTDVAVDFTLATKILNPVPGQDASLRVADNVNLRGVGLVQDIVGEVSQLLGRGLDRVQAPHTARYSLVDSIGQGENTVTSLDQDGCDIAPRAEGQQRGVDL